MKLCRNCDPPTTKPLSEFYARKGAKDGLRNDCKDCVKARSRAAALKNYEEYKRRMQQHYRNNKQARLAACKDYEKKNRVAIQTRKRAYERAHPEQTRRGKRDWERRNPEYLRLRSALASARRRNAEGTFTHLDIVQLWEDQFGLCFYCDKFLQPKYHIDHKTPLSKGGTNWPSNLALACPNCNLQKSDKTVEEYFSLRIKSGLNIPARFLEQ
jgi:5-methylcytosine-specific restriction endonuclease McrA